MKEFYNVDLTIINNEDDNFTLENCTAELTLPMVKDISENSKSLVFREVTAEILPTVLENMGLAVIKD